MFAGREKETQRALIHQLFSNIISQVGITPQDVETSNLKLQKNRG